MAAKCKKRLCKNENKLLKLDKLQLTDVICPICQSILVEPVTLPCYHDFCKTCFTGTVENNALCCPMCRLRIGSWLRTATKQNSLVNLKLWNFLQDQFIKELQAKYRGVDIEIPEDKPSPRLSVPGEIRTEYEAELRRLRLERLQLEEKHRNKTELLIKKIQEEEEEAHRKYMETVKKDELLAQTIQDSTPRLKNSSLHTHGSLEKTISLPNHAKSKLKTATIDNFLVKKPVPKIPSPLLTDDNSSTNTSSPDLKIPTAPQGSPEMIPTYNKLNKKSIDSESKTKPIEQGESSKSLFTKMNIKGKPSLPVSLPIIGILQHKRFQENQNTETSSVDSMRQELCYFKPIEGTTPTSFKFGKGLPLRVPGVRGDRENRPTSLEKPRDVAPSRNEYIAGLCRLRNISLAQNLPSAFVIALSMLKGKKESPAKGRSKGKQTSKKKSNSTTPIKKLSQVKKKVPQIADAADKADNKSLRRRTRSMGSLSHGEVTPKKAKTKLKKSFSDRKPHLRSDSKKNSMDKSPNSVDLTNNNKVSLVAKNLSGQLDNCHVNNILAEQLRIERLIEQEKKDMELARKMDAELNGRKLRGAPVKRQITLNYALRPPKKLKV